MCGRAIVGWIRVLIWVGDVDNMDIGRRLDPSDLLAGQLLKGATF